METEHGAQEAAQYEENQQPEALIAAEEQYSTDEENNEEKEEPQPAKTENHEDRNGFVHGLCVGLGIGCIATFIIMWITVFFTPQLPSAVTYEALLSIFIYPLVYLLAVGLVALTAGIVREYYTVKRKS